jgi:hypothetical protein
VTVLIVASAAATATRYAALRAWVFSRPSCVLVESAHARDA